MYFGVDIGGTKVLVVVADRSGRVLGRAKAKVAQRDPDSVLALAENAARKAARKAGVESAAVKRVGLAVPSAVHRGRAIHAPALDWRDAPIARIAEKTFDRPAFVGNDVNLGMAAEYLHGAARKATTAVGFFLGTGVGGAVIHRGELLRGHDGMAGELGHATVVPGGRRCGCGNQGCLEAYASKTALLKRLKEEIFEKRRRSQLRREIDPQTRMIRSSQLHAAWEAGDRVTRQVIEEGLAMLGPALASMLSTLSPERIVLGGGVIEKFGEPLVERIRAWTEPHVFGDKKRTAAIVASALGDDAVPLGAARLARRKGALL